MNKPVKALILLLILAFSVKAAQDYVLVNIIVPGKYVSESVNYGTGTAKYAEARKLLQEIPQEPSQGYLDKLDCDGRVSKADCQLIKDYIQMYTSPGYNFPRACEGKVTHAYLQAVLYMQLRRESHFDKTLVSPDDARGICQFTPVAARRYHLTNFFNNADCIRAQSEYMKDIYNLNYINCNIPLGISAYHAGENNHNILNGQFAGGPQNTQYVRDIMNWVQDSTGVSSQFGLP